MIVLISYIFFFISTATTEIYTLSLHDALPISVPAARRSRSSRQPSLCRQLVETRQQRLPLRLRQRRPRLALRNVRHVKKLPAIPFVAEQKRRVGVVHVRHKIPWPESVVAAEAVFRPQRQFRFARQRAD